MIEADINKSQMKKLAGFKEIKGNQIKKIKVGDLIRYFSNQQFRMGGLVKFVKYPDYIVLANYSKNVTWSVQLKQPFLRLWIKTKEQMADEREIAKTLYKQKVQNESSSRSREYYVTC